MPRHPALSSFLGVANGQVRCGICGGDGTRPLRVLRVLRVRRALRTLPELRALRVTPAQGIGGSSCEGRRRGGVFCRHVAWVAGIV